MPVAGEDQFIIEVGFGLYTAELPSGIPNGYCMEANNVVGSGESLENRLGFNYSPVDYFIEQPVTPENVAFTLLYNDNPTYPVLGWPDGNFLCFIRGSARLTASVPTGDGFMRVNADSSVVTSLCNYGPVTYFSTATAIYKINVFNWATDAITISPAITTAVKGLYGMFSFKDRLWGHVGNILYFTNPATVTTQPETWSAVTQAIPVEGPNGAGEILKVIPLNSRLIIFTSNGLYALTVQGEPASWNFKVLDSRSLSNHRQCAFERNNLIYYTNSLGVYVTDGYEVTKLSSSIDDKFLTYATGSTRYSINFLNDGMLLSLSRNFKVGAQLYYDKDFGKLFYSRLDVIAWTEWDITNYHDPDTGVFTNYNIAGVNSTSDNIYTFLSPDPLSFMLLNTSKSTVAAPLNSVLQLCTYDGFENKLKVNNPISVLTEEIHMKVRTGYTDFGAPYDLKHVKYAFGELFTNDAEYDFETWWVVDGTKDIDKPVNTMIMGDTPGEGTNLVKIKAGFHTRRASLSFHTVLQSLNSQVKIKNFIAILHMDRKEFKDIR